MNSKSTRSNNSSSNNHRSNKKGIYSIALTILFLIAIALGYYLNELSVYILYWYLALSIVTFFVYGVDKFKAQTGRWRIPEKTLHILSLLGGWPGAALAQQLFKHKSTKRAFRLGYWLTVVFNISCIIALYWYDYLSFI